MAIQPGDMLGVYRIEERVGRGGMASVFKATDTKLNVSRAIKVIAAQYADDPKFVARFKREAQAVASLDHPNILPIYAFGEEPGEDILYIVMRFVNGGTLSDRLKVGTPPPLKESLNIIQQIGEALAYAHERGLVHRDVKPANVLIEIPDATLRRSSPRYFLADFGIAKLMETNEMLTGTGVGIGTPEYMSPEQGTGDPVDGRSDIYSLGIMLYQMLSGKVPFSGRTPLAVLQMQVSQPLPSIRLVSPELPVALELIINKATAKHPGDRYATMQAFLDALQEIFPAAGNNETHPTNPVTAEVTGPLRESDLSTPITRPKEVITPDPGATTILPKTKSGFPAMIWLIPILILMVCIVGGLLLLTPMLGVTVYLFGHPPQGVPLAYPVTTWTPELSPTKIVALNTVPSNTVLPVPSNTVLPNTVPSNTIGPTLDPTNSANPDYAITSAAYSPNGKYLAVGTNHGELQLFDAVTLKEIKAVTVNENPVAMIRYSPDGQNIAFILQNFGLVIVTADTLTVMNPDSNVDGCGQSDSASIAYNSTGSLIVVNGSPTCVLTVATGHKALFLDIASNQVAFSHDDKTIAIVDGVHDHPGVHIMDAVTGKEIRSFGEKKYDMVVYSHLSNSLATSDGSDIDLWDSDSGKLIKTLSSDGYGAVRTADADHLLVRTPYNLHMWTLDDKGQLKTSRDLRIFDTNQYSSIYTSVAFPNSPQDDHLFIGLLSFKENFVIYNLTEGKIERTYTPAP